MKRISLLGLLFLIACSSTPTVTHREVEQAASSASPFVGRSAPAFALENDRSQMVSLESLRGRWVVLYFYPQDDTPGCTCQANEFTELLARFHEMNAQVVGISPDTPVSHEMFREKYGLKIDLLSDVSHETMRAYGAWMYFTVEGKQLGRVVRSTFIIDPNGTVAWHWPEVVPRGHAQRVREKLSTLQAAGR
jgi:peroxiredoxin Q/BCP